MTGEPDISIKDHRNGSGGVSKSVTCVFY